MKSAVMAIEPSVCTAFNKGALARGPIHAYVEQLLAVIHALFLPGITADTPNLQMAQI